MGNRSFNFEAADKVHLSLGAVGRWLWVSDEPRAYSRMGSLRGRDNFRGHNKFPSASWKKMNSLEHRRNGRTGPKNKVPGQEPTREKTASKSKPAHRAALWELSRCHPTSMHGEGWISAQCSCSWPDTLQLANHMQRPWLPETVSVSWGKHLTI